MSLSLNDPWNMWVGNSVSTFCTWPSTSTSQHGPSIFMNEARALPLHHNRHLKLQLSSIHRFFISSLHACVKKGDEYAACPDSRVLKPGLI
jgi:hypothetical protein